MKDTDAKKLVRYERYIDRMDREAKDFATAITVLQTFGLEIVANYLKIPAANRRTNANIWLNNRELCEGNEEWSLGKLYMPRMDETIVNDLNTKNH